MVLGWRRRRKNSGGKPTTELVIPNHFRCPISLDLMKDPVTLSTGITYDRDSIERWFLDGNFTCPVTNQILPSSSSDLIPNHTLRVMIQDWCVENRQERIPTPRTPISPVQVSELLLLVKSSARRADPHTCLELVRRLATWGDESERNRKCIVKNNGGTTGALAYAFDAFATTANDYWNEMNLSVLLEEILSALNWLFPLDTEARRYLGSKASLRCMVFFLKSHDLVRKEKSIVTLKELLSFGDEKQLEALREIEGFKELLVGFINKRMSPTITKASLSLVFYLVPSMRVGFVQVGLVSSLLEILLDSSERSLCEKALGVFDSICCCEEGRGEAYSNALTIPVLVKKILRVSGMGTDWCVSALWKLLCKNGEDNDEIVIEALQVGAFQKLLLVLQVGCGDETKVKATEILKLLNPYRIGLECIDSDFKNLKRSY